MKETTCYISNICLCNIFIWLSTTEITNFMIEFLSITKWNYITSVHLDDITLPTFAYFISLSCPCLPAQSACNTGISIINKLLIILTNPSLPLSLSCPDCHMDRFHLKRMIINLAFVVVCGAPQHHYYTLLELHWLFSSSLVLISSLTGRLNGK